MKYTIRRAQHSDAEAIIIAHVRSIREVCSKDYTPEQIEAWSTRSRRNHKAQLWCQSMDRDFVWVVEKDAKVLGFGHLANMGEGIGEVMGLYFAPELRGQGAGKDLFVVLITQARALNLQELQLHATLTARTFYEKLGFRQSPGKCSVEISGVDIPCFPMSRVL